MLRILPCSLLTLSLCASAATVRYDPSSPDTAPFPSDAFTLADTDQKTGRRINLPFPDCEKQPSTCNELNLVNQLDGFSLNARVSARFSSAVDTATLPGGLLLVALDNLGRDEPGIHRTGDIVKVNQVSYDPATNTVFAKPDAVLDQHRRYALLVTDAVRDTAGTPVTADPAYIDCAQGNGGGYCATLAAAVRDLAAKAAPRKVVAASVFTTMSATAWLEKAWSALNAFPPEVKLGSPRTVFKFSDISGIVLRQHTGVDPVRLSSFTFPLETSLLKGLGTFAMGSFRSPVFLDDKQTIAPLPTAAILPVPTRTNEVFFNALLPESAKPEAGYPVVIFGHGFGDSRFGGPTAVASSLTSAGFAVIAINAVGHGFGPESTVTLQIRGGNPVTIRTGGRGIDSNGDGRIDANEGCVVASPIFLGTRDCLRQTVVDLMQLVRAIRTGIDVDGDGKPDLDYSRMYYGGQSLGAIYGTIFNAIEPRIRAATLNVGGGSIATIARISPSYRALATAAVTLRTPALLNKGRDFDDDYVLRDRPVKTISVNGATALQDFFERIEWLGSEGDPLSFAPHLKVSPIRGFAPKPVLFQFAQGDRSVPNPANSALIRAAGGREQSWMYRHDLARKVVPDLPVNPHPYLVLFVDLDGDTVRLPNVIGLGISAFVQEQMASFFSADGATIEDPNNALVQLLIGGPLFEVPAKLPEDLNF